MASIADELETASGNVLGEEEAMPQVDPALLKEMAAAGLLYGKKKSQTFPRMKPFIVGNRNGIEIIDLAQTMHCLERAEEFVKSVVRQGGTLFFVATQPSAQSIVERIATTFHYPFVVTRWLGGTFTNFKVIAKRNEYFKKIKADRDANRLGKYTKKERVLFDREIERLEKDFRGLDTFDRLPSALVLINPLTHATSLREAKRMGIPVVAVISTDSDPLQISYPIPANDNARMGLEWIFGRLEQAIADAQREAPLSKEEVSAAKNEHTV